MKPALTDTGDLQRFGLLAAWNGAARRPLDLLQTTLDAHPRVLYHGTVVYLSYQRARFLPLPLMKGGCHR